MDSFRIINISEQPELRERAAEWFHLKWSIPVEEYLGSIGECIAGRNAVPQWYMVLEGGEIIGGAGVIDNDFHERKDLSPNVCAIYVEEWQRCRGIAGRLLEHICLDMKRRSVAVLYLVTDHTTFYERYGWSFLGMVQETGSGSLIRMYRKAL